jgi:hypothetical protein
MTVAYRTEVSMGFGVSMGPRWFRVRVSTRGVGVSSGVGPFSVYASGRGGRRRRSTRSAVSYRPADRSPSLGPLDVTQSGLAGVSAHQLAPTGVDELVNQLNSAERWLNGWLWGMVATLVVAIVVPWALILTVVVAVVAGSWVPSAAGST